MNVFCKKIVENVWFDRVIISLIVLNGIILGLETVPELLGQYESSFVWGNRIILAVFIVEAVIKIISHAPQMHRYFYNGWNVFDFSIVVLSLIPASGEFAMLARLARLLRVLRLISVIPELRIIVATLVRSIPSMGNIMLLMSIIFYIYAVAGYHLFHEHDPEHWRNLGMSLLTLFRIVTLEDWTDVMYTAMEMHYLAWIYFVSFVIVGTFVVINLFIAVVINNLEEAKADSLRELEQPVSQKDLIAELKNTKEALSRLEQRLNRL
ncbi:MAG: ion transporter [Gammaproteobacteria bacterium]|nr:ion transporter [Gammaproteobacteria bacterium]